MRKVLISAILAICLILTAAIGVSAAGEDYSIELLVNDSKTAKVEVGNEVTVTLKLKNNGAESYDLFSMQDYVCFDPELLEFVDGSIEVYTPEGGSAPLCSASALKFTSDKHDRVYISRTSLTSAEMLSDANLLTFKLKAIRNGVVEIINKKAEVFEVPGHLYSTALSNASVTIGSAVKPEEIVPEKPDTPGQQPVENPEPKVNPFKDVKNGAYYYDAVLWALENKITEGVSPDLFSPDSACSRAQMVTFLWRNAGCPKPGSEYCPFNDVKKGSYYYDAVLWANEKNITLGTSATTFSPDEPCTRGQMATFLWRTAGCPKPTGLTCPFVDVQKGAYYYDAILWAYGKKITTGITETTFVPDIACSRAQMVTFLYRNHQ